MNAIRHLLKDHEEVGKLFNQFVETGDEAYQQKQMIAEQVVEEIAKHAKLEEEVLFPAFREKGGEEAEEIVQEAIEEHPITELMIDRLQKVKPEDKRFDARFKVLMESTKHHFMEEERELFPKAKKALQGDLDRLGKEMTAFEKQLMKN